jgi:hypothetical protein
MDMTVEGSSWLQWGWELLPRQSPLMGTTRLVVMRVSAMVPQEILTPLKIMYASEARALMPFLFKT